MIEIQNLTKRFTQGSGRKARVVQAVDGVAFTAADGRITGLLGPNGAGKTTTLRMVAALIAPDAGSITVDGLDVVAQPAQALARMGVEAANARAESLAAMLDMKPLLERRTEGFSQGERMKTALARALVHDPANIVLDEPTNGLDVLATRALRDSLRWLRTPEGGAKCIVFSTHIMQEVERLCDSVVVVSHGRTVANGTVDELRAQTGERYFEEAFVKLAFGEISALGAPVGPEPAHAPPAAGAGT